MKFSKTKKNIQMIRNTSFKKDHKTNLGRPCSLETRKKISEDHKGKCYSEDRKKHMSESHKGKIISEKTREKISNANMGKIPKNLGNGKFGNVKRGWYEINGIKYFFRSGWEANYALYLDFLVKQNQIKKWEYEKDVFIFNKIKFGTRSYRPDFKIINNDNTCEYWEVKGYMDARSKTKIKRMAKYYPDIKLMIIDKDVYVDIKKKLGNLLKFY